MDSLRALLVLFVLGLLAAVDHAPVHLAGAGLVADAGAAGAARVMRTAAAAVGMAGTVPKPPPCDPPKGVDATVLKTVNRLADAARKKDARPAAEQSLLSEETSVGVDAEMRGRVRQAEATALRPLSR